MSQKEFLKKLLAIVFIILFLIVSFLLFNFKEKSEDADVGEKVYCKPEQRNADVCIEIYAPVCGFSEGNLQIKTFSNSCFACMGENVEYYIDGECK